MELVIVLGDVERGACPADPDGRVAALEGLAQRLLLLETDERAGQLGEGPASAHERVAVRRNRVRALRLQSPEKLGDLDMVERTRSRP